ncbi:hypothetical protein CC86DRAFT_170557 [Ophiobolus disseminans]|uniref:Uncharacterized protein n=1 Tax=Ophiobolus disseminans TaxID=1469910 RepID=A0A6A6ZAN6_9PLEO|nr:hypothetical protein CC86DRAFT_170557 [Ophiobolus disseminans]
MQSMGAYCSTTCAARTDDFSMSQRRPPSTSATWPHRIPSQNQPHSRSRSRSRSRSGKTTWSRSGRPRNRRRPRLTALVGRTRGHSMLSALKATDQKQGAGEESQQGHLGIVSRPFLVHATNVSGR